MKTSTYGLFNMNEVTKQIKKADTVYWYEDTDGAQIVSDGHFIFKFYGVCEALYARFQMKPGSTPLNSTKYREAFEAPQLKSCFEKFLNEEQNAVANDTRLTYDATGKDAKAVRVIYSSERDSRSYVYLDASFFACIALYDSMTQEQASDKKPVTLVNGNEKAVILPVNILYKPAVLAEL